MPLHNKEVSWGTPNDITVKATGKDRVEMAPRSFLCFSISLERKIADRALAPDIRWGKLCYSQLEVCANSPFACSDALSL